MKKTLTALLAVILLLGTVQAVSAAETVILTPETVEYFSQLASEDPKKGKPFLELSCLPELISPVIFPGSEDALWFYTIFVTETNGVPCTIESIDVFYYRNELDHDKFTYTPEDLFGHSETFEAYEQVVFNGALPAMGDLPYKLVVAVNVLTNGGDELRFCCLADFTFDMAEPPVGTEEYLASVGRPAEEGSLSLRVSFSPDPVTPLPPEAEDEGPFWQYTVTIEETAGVPCTVKHVILRYFDDTDQFPSEKYNPANLGLGDGFLPAGGQLSFTGGLPVQDIRYHSCEVVAEGPDGETQTFIGLVELMQE